MPADRTKRVTRRSTAPMVCLTLREADILVRIANYYERAMGPMRFLVRLTAPSQVRIKYAFVREESKWLRRFAETTSGGMVQAGRPEAQVAFTPRALVAFWGRLLASLSSRRSRRRLSSDEIAAREQLAGKLEEAVHALWLKEPDLIDRELETRRPVEAQWMREKLRREA